MNRNVERTANDLRKVEALMFAFENTYLDVVPEDETFELNDNRQYAFLAIQDAIATVADDVERLAADVRIVEVIQAIAEKDKQ